MNCIAARNAADYSSKFDEAQKRMLHLPSYKAGSLFSDDRVIIGSTCYEKYPITTFEEEGYLIVLEGMIYNLEDSETGKRLIDLLPYLDDHAAFKDRVKDLVSEADGEYLILIYDKMNRSLRVFNDVRGRLPVYYHRNDHALFVSREIKFMHPFSEPLEIDRVSLMEYLLYGFVLGERTLLRGVKRLMPASLILYDVENGDLLEDVLVPLNFDDASGAGSKETVLDLRELFLRGLNHRAGKLGERKAVISLSGGLDSRATLAGLVKLGVRPEGITYDQEPAYSRERHYAEKIAGAFDIKLRYLEPSREIEAEEYSRAVYLGDGLYPTRIAYLLDISDQVSRLYGNDVFFFTGMYGGEMFRYFNVTSGLGSDEDLVDFLLTTPDKYRYDTGKVCRMLGIGKDAIERHLGEHVSNYMEEDVYKKYIHFKFEYDYKWAGAGEDRYRLYYWSMTPFYSREFFDYAYGIDENRKDTLFFRDFLHGIDPRTCDVEYFATPDNIINLNNIMRLRLLGITERAVRIPWIRKAAWTIVNLKNGLTGNDESGEELRKVRDIALNMLNSSDKIKKYFSWEESKEIVEKERDVNMLHRILTIFMYIDQIEGIRS